MTQLGFPILAKDYENLSLDELVCCSYLGGSLVVADESAIEYFSNIKCKTCGIKMHFLGQLHCPLPNLNLERLIIIYVCLESHCQKSNENFRVFRYTYEYNEKSVTSQADWGISCGEDDWGDEEPITDKDDKNNFFILENETFIPHYIEFDHESNELNNAESKKLLSKITDHRSREIAEKYMSMGNKDADSEVNNNLEAWIKAFAIEKELHDDEDNLDKDVFSQLENYTQSKPVLETVRYFPSGNPIFHNSPSVELEKNFKCPSCGGTRSFELQVFSNINNFLKLNINSMNHVMERLKDKDLTPIPGSSIDWILKFATLLIFTCQQTSCKSNRIVEEYCLIQNWEDNKSHP